MSDRRPRKRPPSRHHKRRAANLFKVYLSRSKPHGHWLETHIWHAKRFRMVTFHGFKVASKSFQRSFRPAYRDSMTHCTIQDVSFMACFQLEGPEDTMLEHLNALCSKEIGLTFNSPVYKKGDVEGQITLYAPSEYPYHCIGTFKFIWLPKNPNTVDSIGQAANPCKRLLIWVHPAVIDQFEKCLVKLFTLTLSDVEGSVRKKNRVYKNDRSCIQLTILCNEYNRFKLIGPKSTAILNNTLRRPDQNHLTSVYPEYSITQCKAWEYFRNNLCQSHPGQIRPGSIISLIVEDPRVYTYYKKTVPTSVHYNMLNSENWDCQKTYACSPLWDKIYMDKIHTKKLCDPKLNQKRSEFTKIGQSVTDSLLCQEPDLVPVLLICNGGCKHKEHFGQGSGWDIILPANWSMPFWIALQYRTARAVGLESSENFSFECQKFSFPRLWPDTEAGDGSMQIVEKYLLEKLCKRPENRRTKFDKLKIKYPFKFPWCELLTGWSGNEIEEFYVFRDRQNLRLLSDIVDGKKSFNNDVFWRKNALVQITICSLGKGIPKRFAMLCLPESVDCEKFLGRVHLMESALSSNRTEKMEQSVPTKVWKEQDFIQLVENKKIVDLNYLFAVKQQEKLRRRRFMDKMKKKRRKIKVTDVDQRIKSAKEHC